MFLSSQNPTTLTPPTGDPQCIWEWLLLHSFLNSPPDPWLSCGNSPCTYTMGHSAIFFFYYTFWYSSFYRKLSQSFSMFCEWTVILYLNRAQRKAVWDQGTLKTAAKTKGPLKRGVIFQPWPAAGWGGRGLQVPSQTPMSLVSDGWRKNRPDERVSGCW